jgi:hypothetical protein
MRNIVLPLALAGALAACKAKPAEPAGFVVDKDMSKHADLPFHRAWRNPKGDLQRYSRIHVAPVATSHLMEMDWWKQGEAGTVSKFKEDVDKIAVRCREMVVAMYRDPPEGVKNRYAVVDEPKGNDTLVLELAIVEIVPSKATLEALSWVMPFGTGVLLTPLNTSTAAMEGQFRDADTGDVLLAFADREGEKARPVDLAGFTWYTHAGAIMKDWAKQLVQVANQKPGEVIKDTKVYTLKPW